jgi:hypothetical protein
MHCRGWLTCGHVVQLFFFYMSHCFQDVARPFEPFPQRPTFYRLCLLALYRCVNARTTRVWNVHRDCAPMGNPSVWYYISMSQCCVSFLPIPYFSTQISTLSIRLNGSGETVFSDKEMGDRRICFTPSMNSASTSVPRPPRAFCLAARARDRIGKSASASR